jgi:exosortase/archaeosortase family protein
MSAIPRQQLQQLQQHLHRAPAGLWLALLAAALWPTGVWMAQRMADGSDDPLGLLALAALGALVWQQRRRLRPQPRPAWLAAALVGALAATALRPHLPPLACALLSLLAWAAGVLALVPARTASAPVLGLAVLSLPLLASLQFYAGYPLRTATAEASRWLLSIRHHAVREGSSLVVDGHRVVVDAPCSGIQMVWLGYFTACVVVLAGGASNRWFLTRLPAVGLLVLGGNVLRNTVLVALEAAGCAPAWVHETVGLAVLALVCGGIAGVMAGGRQHA